MPALYVPLASHNQYGTTWAAHDQVNGYFFVISRSERAAGPEVRSARGVAHGPHSAGICPLVGGQWLWLSNLPVAARGTSSLSRWGRRFRAAGVGTVPIAIAVAVIGIGVGISSLV